MLCKLEGVLIIFYKDCWEVGLKTGGILRRIPLPVLMGLPPPQVDTLIFNVFVFIL